MSKGILEGCLLMVVKEKPLYSKEIVESLRGYGFKDLTGGTIFPMLVRLEKQGLFEVKKVPVSSAPSRKYYSLSEKGERELIQFQNVWDEFRNIVENIMNKGEA